ncbi:MAG: hypothetical protein KKA32_00855 [Actinobacteria bacterium]|nr:hypothetical protein [Actinomycetota bacterium]
MRDPIRSVPGSTEDGRPFDFYVQREVERGNWRLERVSGETLGTPRDLEVYRGKRKTNLIVDWVNSAADRDYCCEYWADLKVGKGPCGYRCAECFLILTHRVKADPSRHLLYENTEDFIRTVQRWLHKRGARQALGLGIDCSDSLLYEGVTGYARTLIPMFADPDTNPFKRHLVMLTKSANVHYLEGLPTENVVVTFSLNPQPIADIFEGRYPDGLRVTPDIGRRLEASAECGRMGFTTRWRVDPIVPVDGWQDSYREFFADASRFGPERITFGIYRQMGPALKKFAEKWGLVPMEWSPPAKMEKDGGTHLQLPRAVRIDTYRQVREMIEQMWPEGTRPTLALCKENSEVRRAAGMSSRHCNCE